MKTYIYNKKQLQKSMLNNLCPFMESFYSDIIIDFALIDGMKVGEILYCFVRKNGTQSCRTLDDFNEAVSIWGSKVLFQYDIAKIGRDIYEITYYK